MLLGRDSRILLQGIDADHKIRDLVLLDHIPMLGQRLAFNGAATRVRLGEPRQHDRLFPLEVRQRVGLTVRGLELEIRSGIADLQVSGPHGERTASQERHAEYDHHPSLLHSPSKNLGQDMRYASAEIKGSCFEPKIGPGDAVKSSKVANLNGGIVWS